MPRLTLEEFTKRCVSVHGEKYTYEKVVYENNRTPVEVFCTIHGGYFLSSPESLFKGHGCAVCAGCKRPSTEEFIAKAELKHPGKFGYEKVVYKNAKTMVKLYCKQHKDYFEITPNKLLCGAGCNECNRRRTYTNEEYIEKIKKIHGDNYKYDKVLYKGNNSIITLYCNIHGSDIVVNSSTVLKGFRCGVCSGKIKYNNEIFIQKSKKVHNHENYNYDLVDYKSSEEKVKIKCIVHNSIFETTPKSFLTGRGCPKCGKYGYQPSKPGYFYIQELNYNNEVYYKFGITGDLERRLIEQSRDSLCNHAYLITKYFEIGSTALELENLVKNTVICGILSSDVLPSGFTETFESKDLETVLKLVQEY